jgi:protein O-GlcNAc transferase
VAPAVNASPIARDGVVTFGSLNNFRKVSRPALATWCRVLSAVPHSRLHLHTLHGPHRDRVLGFFQDGGVSADRVRFIDPVPLAEYFALYHDVDVALDPFPYAGGTTTLDAAYMGVPTVTFAGDTAVGRGGVSINSNLGLHDLITHAPGDYVRVAASLANDRPRLADLRATLRQRMGGSPLMDAPRFVRHLEAAYVAMGALGFEPRTKGL